MSHGGFYIPRLFRYMPRDLGGLTILDAGSGRGEVAYYIHAFTDGLATDLRGHPKITGVDIYRPSVDFTRTWLPKIYDSVECLDIVDVERWAAGRRWDMAMLLEVPEHVPKDKMLAILDQVERVADYILIATPYGDELNQDYGDVVPEFNHVSVWYPRDFEERGYSVEVEEVVPNPIGDRLIWRIYMAMRRVLGKPVRVQRKIIAVRNPKNLPVSKGISWGGLRS